MRTSLVGAAALALAGGIAALELAAQSGNPPPGSPPRVPQRGEVVSVRITQTAYPWLVKPSVAFVWKTAPRAPWYPVVTAVCAMDAQPTTPGCKSVHCVVSQRNTSCLSMNKAIATSTRGPCKSNALLRVWTRVSP